MALRTTVLAGSTSSIWLLFLQDSSQTDNRGLTGLAYNTASLVCYYKTSNGTASVAVTLVTIAALGTYASSGFKEVDATNMPGVYEFHPPNLAFAAGVTGGCFEFKGATNLKQTFVDYEVNTGEMQKSDIDRITTSVVKQLVSGRLN